MISTRYRRDSAMPEIAVPPAPDEVADSNPGPSETQREQAGNKQFRQSARKSDHHSGGKRPFYAATQPARGGITVPCGILGARVPGSNPGAPISQALRPISRSRARRRSTRPAAGGLVDDVRHLPESRMSASAMLSAVYADKLNVESERACQCTQRRRQIGRRRVVCRSRCGRRQCLRPAGSRPSLRRSRGAASASALHAASAAQDPPRAHPRRTAARIALQS